MLQPGEIRRWPVVECGKAGVGYWPLTPGSWAGRKRLLARSEELAWEYFRACFGLVWFNYSVTGKGNIRCPWDSGVEYTHKTFLVILLRDWGGSLLLAIKGNRHPTKLGFFKALIIDIF